MAYLQPDQIRQILSKPTGLNEVESCQAHDKRSRFHTTPALKANKLPYLSSFLEWVGKIINPEKLSVFQHLLTVPIDTVEFTESIFAEFLKIFEARDRHLEFRFTNPELAKDFQSYLEDKGDNLFWKMTAFQKMKSAINSIMIIDLPAYQDPKDRFPRPYYYFLDIERLHSIAISANYKVEFIAFKSEDDNILYVFDDGHFRTYKRNGGDWTLLNEVPHNLGYTPARSFWTTPFEDNSKLQKRGPQTNSLGKLDWLLTLEVSSKHVELYAGFPIDVIYETRCDYHDAQGNKCEGGKVIYYVAGGLDGSEQVKKVDDCPNCKNKSTLGAGTVLTAPARASMDDPDLLEGMKRISADEVSLTYLMKKITAYKAEISTNVIGFVSETIREAMNKEQVGSMLEAQIAALTEVRDNFEAIHKFVLETCARLRYGSQAVVSITCNYGSKWFIHSIEKQQEQYKESKSNGFANFELTSQMEQILLTKYKNNPTMLERCRTLFAIEPYLNYTVGDLKSLQDTFGLNEELVRLKLDFSNYVQRFEREYMNLGEFMQFSSFDTKIAFVREKLLTYVKEDYPEEEEEETEEQDPTKPTADQDPAKAFPPVEKVA